jgi:hypothetical protein
LPIVPILGKIAGPVAQAENFARSPESVKERLDSDDELSKIPLNELSKRVDAFSPHVNLPNREFPTDPGFCCIWGLWVSSVFLRFSLGALLTFPG